MKGVHHFCIGGVGEVKVEELVEVDTALGLLVDLAVEIAEEGGREAGVEGREVFFEGFQGEAVGEGIHEDLLVDGVEGELVLGLASLYCAVGEQVRVVEAVLIAGVLEGLVLFLRCWFCCF